MERFRDGSNDSQWADKVKKKKINTQVYIDF